MGARRRPDRMRCPTVQSGRGGRGRPRQTILAAAVAASVAFSSSSGAAGAQSSVSVVLAADVTKCLGVFGREVTLRHCMKGEGVAWAGDPGSLTTAGKLEMLAVELPGGEVKQARRLANQTAVVASECLRLQGGIFSLWPCAMTETVFQWDAETLQLKTGGKCVGSISGTLTLVQCKLLAGFGTDNGGDASRDTDQNGHGAPATQTWILLPTDRPQVKMLDTVALPLHVSGRYITDTNGNRVKLVGVNWMSALAQHSSAQGAPAPSQVAQVIKYLGFNSVRIAFSDESDLSTLDRLVKAATDEKLLVVLARRADDLPFVNATDQQMWLKSLSFMAGRYRDDKRVVGLDVHSGPGLQEDGTHTVVPMWGEHWEAWGNPSRANLLEVGLVWRCGGGDWRGLVWH